MTKINRGFAKLILATVAGILFFFAAVTLLSSCTKLPKTPPTGGKFCPCSINGRWGQVADTSTHFYIDSATHSTLVLRYPTMTHGPLTTYARVAATLLVDADTIRISSPQAPRQYELWRIGTSWYGRVHMQDNDREPVTVLIRQLDNNNDQPGPAVVTPL